jgi:hypothetical protein
VDTLNLKKFALHILHKGIEFLALAKSVSSLRRLPKALLDFVFIFNFVLKGDGPADLGAVCLSGGRDDQCLLPSQLRRH